MLTTYSLRLAVVLTCLFALTPPLLCAQAFRAVPVKLTFDDLPSPEFSGGKQKSFKPRNWLEVEATFTLEMLPEPPSKMADRVLVKWYVAVKHPDRPRSFLLLTRDVTHVNVPLKTEVASSVYISPNSLTRLTGTDRSGKSAVELVGYEILVNGQKVAEATNKGRVGWWNVASEGISRSEMVPLLNKAETPFAAMWWDRYAEILSEGR